MSTGIDIKFLQERYQQISDDELILIATNDTHSLTQEAKDALKVEIQTRGLAEKISKGVDATYILFEVEQSSHTSSGGYLKKLLKITFIRILSIFIPKANPDYDDEIGKVTSWLIELETETGVPQREIGLNNLGEPILKMPYKDNYGYWTDNNLLLNDFKNHFQVKEIDQATFEIKWNTFF